MLVSRVVEKAAVCGAMIWLGEAIQMSKSRKAYKKYGIKGLISSVLTADEIIKNKDIKFESK